MKIGRSPEGKWLLLEGKEVVESFDSKEQAIEALSLSQPPKESVGCKHGSLAAEECILGPELNQARFGRYCRDCNAILLRPYSSLLEK